MLADIRTTEWMLEEWGKWAYKGRGCALDFPSIEPFTRMRGSVLPEPNISDDEGCLVDRIVCELIRTHGMEGEAVALYHLNAGSYRKLAKMLEVDDKAAASLYRAGVMWLDGRIRV